MIKACNLTNQLDKWKPCVPAMTAHLLLSLVVALWVSTALLTQKVEGAVAAPPDALPGSPPAVALLVPPHSGPLGVEVEARQTSVRPD